MVDENLYREGYYPTQKNRNNHYAWIRRPFLKNWPTSVYCFSGKKQQLTYNYNEVRRKTILEHEGSKRLVLKWWCEIPHLFPSQLQYNLPIRISQQNSATKQCLPSDVEYDHMSLEIDGKKSWIMNKARMTSEKCVKHIIRDICPQDMET